ncbi:hypothetical protein ACJJTC_012373 [Scirpophaga incertulas]
MFRVLSDTSYTDKYWWCAPDCSGAFQSWDIYAENLGCLSTIFNTVQSKLWQAHIKNSSHYNLRRKFAEFNVGDVVMKRAYFLSDKQNKFSKKLAPKFIKARVTAKKSPLVYVLQDMSGKDLGTWHIKDLKFNRI